MILNIETTDRICSVALSDQRGVQAVRESAEGYNHSSLLTVFIEELLKENGLQAADLEAVAVSMGPGSYTGLRIGVSTAKGLCYGASVPLVAVPTLDAMVCGFLEKHAGGLPPSACLVPMIDARRMEVYTALYDATGNRQQEVQALVVDEDSFLQQPADVRLDFFGTGAMKCASVIRHPGAVFHDDIRPSAAFMAPLSARAVRQKRFADVAYFEPYYLKDFRATTPKKLF